MGPVSVIIVDPRQMHMHPVVGKVRDAFLVVVGRQPLGHPQPEKSAKDHSQKPQRQPCREHLHPKGKVEHDTLCQCDGHSSQVNAQPSPALKPLYLRWDLRILQRLLHQGLHFFRSHWFFQLTSL